MTPFSRATSLVITLVLLSACRTEQRGEIDSAAGVAESSARASVSVINVRLGRRVDAEKRISDEDDTFAPSDTIYASVHTSGSAKPGSSIVGRWTLPDGSIVNQKASEADINADRLVFFIAKSGGLAAGTYTFQILIDGREVRSKAARVRGR